MAELRVSRESFDYARNLIIQFLRDAEYRGALEDGTGISDVVVKPNALLYALFSQAVDKASAYLSLSRAEELHRSGRLDADEYDAAVDAVLSNWFVTRNPGKPTYGTVRLWFLRPLDFLQFRRGEVVASADNLTLLAHEDRVFTAEDFELLVNTSDNVAEYCVELNVVSALNTDALLTASTPVTAGVDSIYFLRADIPADFRPGVSKESSADFIRRSRAAPTTRELITDRALQTVLPDRHDEILRLYVAGHGDPEQARDIIPFHGVGVHVGNKADIYVAAPLARRNVTLAVGAEGRMELAGLTGHMAHILSLCDETGTPVSYALKVEETRWGAAGYRPESLTVELPEGTPLTLTWLSSPTIPDIQATVEAGRVVCYDPLVKSMHPVVLRMELTVRLLDPKQDSAAPIREAAMAYVTDLAKTGAAWVESEMVAAIHQAVPNVHEVLLPTSCVATVFNPRTGRNVSAPVRSRFEVDRLGPGLSRQISANTIQIYTDAALIAVNPAV